MPWSTSSPTVTTPSPCNGRAAAGIATTHLARRDGEPRAAYDTRLADVVEAADADIVVLAGWMRILTMSFLGRFPGRVVNLHPALPGRAARHGRRRQGVGAGPPR